SATFKMSAQLACYLDQLSGVTIELHLGVMLEKQFARGTGVLANRRHHLKKCLPGRRLIGPKRSSTNDFELPRHRRFQNLGGLLALVSQREQPCFVTCGS